MGNDKIKKKTKKKNVMAYEEKIAVSNKKKAEVMAKSFAFVHS